MLAKQNLNIVSSLCQRCSFEIDDKLSFSSNFSDVGEKLELVGECSPIKDSPQPMEQRTNESDKWRIRHLEKLLNMNLENQAQLQTVLTKESEDSGRIIKKLQSTVQAYEK